MTRSQAIVEKNCREWWNWFREKSIMMMDGEDMINGGKHFLWRSDTTRFFAITHKIINNILKSVVYSYFYCSNIILTLIFWFYFNAIHPYMYAITPFSSCSPAPALAWLSRIKCCRVWGGTQERLRNEGWRLCNYVDPAVFLCNFFCIHIETQYSSMLMKVLIFIHSARLR